MVGRGPFGAGPSRPCEPRARWRHPPSLRGSGRGRPRRAHRALRTSRKAEGRTHLHFTYIPWFYYD